MWRILTHNKLHATLLEVETHWSLDDLADAHAVLDALEGAELRAARERRT